MCVANTDRDIRQEAVEIIIDVALGLEQLAAVLGEILDQRVADIKIVAAEQGIAGHRIFGVAVVIHRHGQAGQPLADV